MEPLLDPRLLSSLKDHFSSRCTIQTVDVAISESEQEVPTGTGTNVLGLVDIFCRIGPLIEVRPTDTEIRTEQIQERRVERQCKLSGFYPQITPHTHQAVVDGIIYPIKGVEHDGSLFSTRLKLEVVAP